MILKEFAVKPLWKKKLAITDKMVAKNLHHFDVFTIIFRWNNYIPDLVRIFPCTNN